MAPRSPVNRFVSFVLFAALALLCIYQGSQYGHESRAVSHPKRSTVEHGDIPLGKDPGEEIHRLLWKRAPAESVDEAARKGEGYLCQLNDVDVDEVLHTKWTDENALNEWFSEQPYGVDNGKPTDTGSSLSTALSALGLPVNVGDRGLKGYIYYQDRDYRQDGEEMDATWGYYRASMSVDAGYISAEDNESPWEASGRTHTPPLSKLSDMYFLFWKMLAKGKDIRNIKYFFRHHVINSHSKKIALEVTGGSIPEWPGVSYDMSTKEGKAILGTPNGSGVAFFLLNHKPELGVRVPTKVTVFKTIGRDSDGQPEDWIHFLFSIAVSRKKK
ncbi:hypothetical protein FQN54_001141 [Arachnomyces sp. PD_36]|nr:hypothetical protein FQN54_001141 [Arachnomyces sp. PD_36]